MKCTQIYFEIVKWYNQFGKQLDKILKMFKIIMFSIFVSTTPIQVIKQEKFTLKGIQYSLASNNGSQWNHHFYTQITYFPLWQDQL